MVNFRGELDQVREARPATPRPWATSRSRILVIFLVVVVVRGIATFDGQNHPGLDYLLFVGFIFGLIFFATLAVKFLFIGDDKD